MAFLMWLETTAYSEWILSGLTGWPIMLTSHAVGLAIVVGIVFAMDLRVLGLFKLIPYTSIHKLMSIAWVGITINIISGLSLFMAQATMYVTSIPFLVKITFIVLGIVNLVYMQKMLKRDAASWDAADTVPPVARALAVSSLLFWTVAVITGRLIAYL